MQNPKAVLQRWFRRVKRRNQRQNQPISIVPEDRIIRRDTKMDAALKNTVDRRFMTTKTHRDRPLHTKWENVHPDIERFARAMKKELEARGIPAWIFELHRTPTRQNKLQKQGFSKAQAWQSPHQFGCAVDIIHGSRLWDLSSEEWAMIGTIGKEVARKLNLNLVWGGDWGWDMAHWELENWRQYRAFMYVEQAENFPLEMLSEGWFAKAIHHIKNAA